jgi:hypothetical protein
MKRAAVLIGVHKAHNLPELHAAWKGVHAMESWALSQGLAPELVRTITDETEKVTPQRIKDTIKEFVERGDLDQLIIYFSGHGVNLKYGEYWLLSDAIEDADAAVNVKGSEERARYSVIPHVVFLSDACRTAPQGVQAQGIEGSIIFPNKPFPGLEKSVDQFYATLLGEPALEIADPKEAAGKFQAVYTDALLEALRGLHADIVDWENLAGHGFIRPRPLKKFLARELPIRVYQATNGSHPRSQQPDARITSDDDAWLSEINEPVTAEPPTLDLPVTADTWEHCDLTREQIVMSKNAFRALIADKSLSIEAALPFKATAAGRTRSMRAEVDSFFERNERFAKNLRDNAEPFGPLYFDTGCGFKIRGAEVATCQANEAQFDIFNCKHLVRANLTTHRTVVSALLTFKNGHSALLPAIQDFITTLTFDGEHLVDVAYEPSKHSSRWADYRDKLTEIRNLRAVIASSSRLGTFHLDDLEAETLARRMQVAKGIDPSLALYAAHAYRDQGNRSRIQQMISAMSGDLGIGLFDIMLLGGRLNDRFNPQERNHIFPFLPMFSQSWALIPAYEVALPPGLVKISQHVLPDSLWTLFDSDGAYLISQIIQLGGVR